MRLILAAVRVLSYGHHSKWEELPICLSRNVTAMVLYYKLAPAGVQAISCAGKHNILLRRRSHGVAKIQYS